MKKEYNMENITSKSFIQQYPVNQEKTTKNNLYDEEFISLINKLNDSIKEYYKVAHHNITEENTYISYYEQQHQSIDILINDIINYNQYQRLNDLYDMNNKNKELLIKLQENSNSAENNLNLFFEQAKILFKGMKMKRKQHLLEINNQNKSTLFKDNNYSTYNKNKTNLNNNINNNGNKLNALIPINKIYIQIVQLLNKLSEFNVIINKTNITKSNEYINLQNNIKKELDLFMKLVKNNLDSNMNNINTNIYSNNNFNITNESYGRRSRSQPHNLNKEIEKLKKINLMYEKKLKDLTNQFNLYRKNNIHGSGGDTDSDSKKREIDINNLNLKIKKLEQIIKEKDALIMNFNNNLNPNINNIIKIKDNQILNLQQEINVYQKNESILNNEITDLNNKFQQKLNQYENQISLLSNKNNSLSQIIMAKNNNILKLQNENKELNMKLKNFNKTKNIVTNIKVQNTDENSINEYNKIISNLKNEVETYKIMINQYELKILELSNNEINNNSMNVNEQNSNKANNSNNFILQKKIEKLNKDIEMMVNKNNMYEQKINVINSKNNQLNKENVFLKKKEKINEEKNNEYIRQIEEMNNNILSTNKILEQKDELIKELTERNNIYKTQNIENKNEINNINKNDNNIFNNSEIRKLKIENEKLQKQIEGLKINKNINLSKNNLLKDKIINGKDIKEIQELSIQLLEENNEIHAQNEELLEKIKQLTLENQQIQESFMAQKKTISKLEGDINKKNEELEGLKTFIFKLQIQLENKDDNLLRIKKKMDGPNKTLEHFPSSDQNKNNMALKKNVNEDKFFNETKDLNTKNLLNKINEYEKKIANLQDKNKELQFKLDDKQVEDLSGFRTEDNNFSNYEEEFDLKRMVSGARDKNRSEDINIDYPGVQGIKDKHKELLQNMKMLEEQIKILINNISCNGKIKPQITQICQLMKIPAKNIQLIIAGKDKKRALGLID